MLAKSAMQRERPPLPSGAIGKSRVTQVILRRQIFQRFEKAIEIEASLVEREGLDDFDSWVKILEQIQTFVCRGVMQNKDRTGLLSRQIGELCDLYKKMSSSLSKFNPAALEPAEIDSYRETAYRRMDMETSKMQELIGELNDKITKEMERSSEVEEMEKSSEVEELPNIWIEMEIDETSTDRENLIGQRDDNISLEMDGTSEMEELNDKTLTEIPRLKMEEMSHRSNEKLVELERFCARPSYRLNRISEEDKAATSSEVEEFNEHRRSWELAFGSALGRCGAFQDTTTLSSMHFTHCTPGTEAPTAAVADRTLQIYSIQISEIKGLEWPLHVYGMVAARDTVDRNRNIIFFRRRSQCQTLTEKDCLLQLTGPSRAIVFQEPVCFEIQLKLRGRKESEDRMLISDTMYHSWISRPLRNHFCTIELGIEPLGQSVQATILGVRVAQGESWPSIYGGRVVCSSSQEVMVIDDQGIGSGTDLPAGHVVLLDSQGEAMPMGSNGYLNLSRNVLSVQEQDSLKVVLQTYSKSGTIDAKGHVCITSKPCNISQAKCYLGDPKVEMEITVAWSLLVQSKMELLASRSVVF